MRAAVICPTSMLGWLQYKFQPTFHMVLAQVYLQDYKYAKFFKIRRLLGDFLLLDQGAAELGAAVCDEALIGVVRQLRPQLVVAPDVLHDGPETVRRTEAFLLKYRETLYKYGTAVMAVPQGHTCEECLDTFELFNSRSGVDWLGISKFHHLKFDGRHNFLAAIAKLKVQRPCHLLGVQDQIGGLLQEKDFPFVKSTDTAKPVKLGLQGLSLEEEGQRVKVQDFFSTPKPPEAVLEAVERNITQYLALTGKQEKGGEDVWKEGSNSRANNASAQG